MQNRARDESSSCAWRIRDAEAAAERESLLGTVMLMMALSLYELFIDAEVKVPARLQIHTSDDLKVHLVSVVIAVMAVTFLGQVMPWDGERQLLSLGISVALVIAALNLYLWIGKGQGRS